MKIDVQPEVKLAEGMWRIACDMYEEPRYVFMHENGTPHTTYFSPKQLEEFLPSKTVSWIKDNWEKSIEEQFQNKTQILAQGFECVLRKIFIYDIESREEIALVEDDKEVWRTLEIRLTKDRRASYQRDVDRLAQQRGKMTFVKLV